MSTNFKLKKREQPKPEPPQEMSGSSMLIQALAREGVDVIFGYPGGAILPTYDEIYKTGIRHILARHEQGAIHAAEGYARVSGKPGVCVVTSGPGATNVVTGIADAMIDSLPLVVITGQVATTLIGTDAFQEADMIGITMPITKHSYQVRTIEDLPRIIKEAFHIATTGRPGPVLIDLPKDISLTTGLFDYDKEVHLPGYQPTVMPNRLQIRKLVEAVSQAKKPVILAGAGVLHGHAAQELFEYVEQQQIPVVNTLLGLGSFPADHELHLGMGGMHGTYTANMAIHESDLLISIGARFDDRLTGNLAFFAPNARVAHIDIDPAEIGKNIETEIPVVGCAKEALKMLIAENGKRGDNSVWRADLQRMKQEYPLWYKEDGETIKPQQLIEKLCEATNGEAIITTDVGQHQMWAAQYYAFNKPNRWVTSGGLGTMGFGFPAAIGAQIAEPSSTVVAVLGDAGFQMTLQELSILQELGLKVKVILVNNASLGMVRQWQQLFHGERYSNSLFPIQPDFVKMAEAYDIKGMKVEKLSEVDQALKEMLDHDGPVLMDFRVAKEENVYPMISPGKGQHEMEGVKP
ncbi:acetolactate synthase large subunit [Halalkalibacterium halodurans]|uniref:acetolactate synthase large subunit n=1 Tax=Halalkalibacterium halodurans TaxID=86665 RepID=UPI002E1ABE2E|nr:acetolactate synthase large subunit [Halalkalibacterium halodurans]MED4084491.1 acetolactate synthase large subunit [Halalkalibacterium halodurans]MED4103685.1 acetolactate synthase large subunit [Halalkalibacterium halodurans]MED4110153.1 acetolactate synthase large subunit [Halalkalibacterium halodurans]MED4125545.1 acetolactate synthase large subunit [Halalkalibacterium halodurans]